MGFSLNSFNKYYFKIWVPILFVLLALVPAFIVFGFIPLAKVSGFLCLITLIIALWYWKLVARNLNKKIAPVSINLNDQYFLDNNLKCYNQLNSSDKKTFNIRLGLFLAEIKSPNFSDSNISKQDWLRLASIVVIIFWYRDYFSFLDYVVFWDSQENTSELLKAINIQKDTLNLFFNNLNEENIFMCNKNIISSNKLSFINELLLYK